MLYISIIEVIGSSFSLVEEAWAGVGDTNTLVSCSQLVKCEDNRPRLIMGFFRRRFS